MGENPLFHAGDEYDRVLEALGGMQRHQGHARVVEADLVRVGHEAHRGEEIGDRAVLHSGAEQFLDVLHSGVDLDLGRILRSQLVQVTGAVDDGLQQACRPRRRGPGVFVAVEQSPQLPYQLDEGGDPPEGFTRDPSFPRVCQCVAERYSLGSSPRVQASHARVAHPPAWDIEDPFQGHLVAGVRNHVQVGEHVFYFPAVVIPWSAEDLVRHPLAGQFFFDGPALRIGAVKNCDVSPAVTMFPAAI